MAMMIPKKSARFSAVKMPSDLTTRTLKEIFKSPARTSIFQHEKDGSQGVIHWPNKILDMARIVLHRI